MKHAGTYSGSKYVYIRACILMRYQLLNSLLICDSKVCMYIIECSAKKNWKVYI